MSDAITLYTPGDRESLYRAVLRLYQLARDRVAAAGDRVDAETGEVMPRVWRMSFDEREDDRSLRQHRFYWGAVLTQISERASLNGQRYTADAWHELFKRQFLRYEVVRATVAGRKRPTIYRRLRSTTKLTVKRMSEYLEKVIAFAATDLGITLDLDPAEREATRYVRPARRAAITQERAPLPLVERVA